MRRLISAFLISAVLCITINALDISDFSSHTDIQHFINTELAENAGVSAEWYVFALCKSGNYDFSKYISALDKYTLQITSYDVTSLKYALAFTACGVENEFTKNVCKQIGAQASVMYTVFSLHLLNNNQPAPVSATELCQRLISLQNEDGGWSVIKGKSDADVSAMVLQALAPHKSLYEENINKALAFLQNIQNENGSFSSYGKENAESIAQVIIALCSLGIDCKTDARFIKNGVNMFDALQHFKVENGFSHTIGQNYSTVATSQAMCAYHAYENKTPFYVFEKSGGFDDEATESTPPAIQQPPTTDETPNTQSNNTREDKVNQTVRIAFIAAVAVICTGVCVYIILSGKNKTQNFVIVILFGAVLVCASFFIDISSPEEYYSDTDASTNESVGKITFSIDCSNVSENGKFFPTDEIDLYEGESVFEILSRISKSNRIVVDASGSGEFAYIKGINGIFQLQHGDLSGWVYTVNGESPSVSCGAYYPKNGDVVSFFYTVDGIIE